MGKNELLVEIVLQRETFQDGMMIKEDQGKIVQLFMILNEVCIKHIHGGLVKEIQ